MAVYRVIKTISRELFDESHYSIGLNRDPTYSQSLTLPTSSKHANYYAVRSEIGRFK